MNSSSPYVEALVLNKLGDRLRTGGLIAEADMELLSYVRSLYDEALAQVTSDTSVTPELTRRDAIEMLGRLSDWIDQCETVRLELRRLSERERTIDQVLKSLLRELPRAFGLEVNSL